MSRGNHRRRIADLLRPPSFLRQPVSPRHRAPSTRPELPSATTTHNRFGSEFGNRRQRTPQRQHPKLRMKAVDLVPDVDDASVAAASMAGRGGSEELSVYLSAAWAATYRSRIPQSALLEFNSDGARFLFDLASEAGAAQADRTVAAWGRSRPAPRLRDEPYQRGDPSPRGPRPVPRACP